MENLYFKIVPVKFSKETLNFSEHLLKIISEYKVEKKALLEEVSYSFCNKDYGAKGKSYVISDVTANSALRNIYSNKDKSKEKMVKVFDSFYSSLRNEEKELVNKMILGEKLDKEDVKKRKLVLSEFCYRLGLPGRKAKNV